MRPHLGIEVNPSHGLYAFFRRKEKEGEVYYDTVEPQDMIHDKGGTLLHAFVSLELLLTGETIVFHYTLIPLEWPRHLQ